MEYEFSDQETRSAKLELFIKILATQKAMSNFLIEMLAKTDGELAVFRKTLEEQTNDYAAAILDDLYLRRGTVRISEILA